MNKEQARETIKKLIDKYETLSEAQKNKYNESMTCKDFILPLFLALGWDVYNNDSDNEVTSETQVSGRRVDYAFYINDVIRFFVEAKKISVDLREEKFAEQAVFYAWHKSVPWAILTDFESIKVFNAEWDEPDVEQSLLFEIPYDEFLTDDRLWLLSKESMLKGDLDEYAEKNFKKPKREPVDKQLASDLLKWRNLLFNELKQWNSKKSLSDKHIAKAVQQILDRLIFIRTTEDREIEGQKLREMVRNWEEDRGKVSIESELKKLFDYYDKEYDSKLFETGICDSLEYEDGLLAKIINELYKNNKGIRYNFASINADILGSIYEQYLGYIQQEDSTGKSSKRKAQGIYYTPRYIVEYIVKNTLGEVLKGKSGHEATQIKILDPACGSGSFLIKAFEVLDNHIKRENNQLNAQKLTNHARKIGILTSNIYGVDLDEEAVEIAQLNLLLKALEVRQRLPNLSHNIENGNSLISGGEQELKKYFGDSWKEKKPFNWEKEFEDVFKKGGFDVIIGNPPYVNLANIKDANEREYLKSEFETAKNKSDLYSFFTEKAIKLLKNDGVLGFIFSNSWLGTDSFSKFREYLVKNTIIYQMVKLSLGVFEDATVTPVLIFLKKGKADKNHKIKIFELKEGRFERFPYDLGYKRIAESPNFNFSFNPEIKIKISTSNLGEIAKFSLGIKTSDDDKFILNKKENDDCYKLLRGKDVARYNHQWAGKWIWYRPDLMMKKVGAGPRKLEYFLKDKILFRSISGGVIMASLDSEKFLTNDKVHILYDVDKFSLKFILGVVNSKLIDFWIKATFNNLLEIKINQLENIPIPKLNFSDKKEKARHDELVVLVDQILKFNEELQKIDPTLDKEEYEMKKREIAKTDQEIDQKVYELYGLTVEEIKIVEGE